MRSYDCSGVKEEDRGKGREVPSVNNTTVVVGSENVDTATPNDVEVSLLVFPSGHT